MDCNIMDFLTVVQSNYGPNVHILMNISPSHLSLAYSSLGSTVSWTSPIYIRYSSLLRLEKI